VAGQITASLVITDRERIEAMFEQIAEAVETGDAPAILAMTDERLEAQGLRKAQFAEWLNDVFERVHIRTPRIQRMDITFESSSTATAMVSGIATVESQGQRQVVAGGWKVDLDKIDGRWIIVAMEPQEDRRRAPF
jgi:hypothetical protein